MKGGILHRGGIACLLKAMLYCLCLNHFKPKQKLVYQYIYSCIYLMSSITCVSRVRPESFALEVNYINKPGPLKFTNK